MPTPTAQLRLRPYTDEDRWLTETIETSPVMMADLCGPLP
jgi:RimJ/RimL family protein N-acetyltransferase